MQKKRSAKKFLKYWKEAWDLSNKMNPWGMSIEAHLEQYGISTYDIREELGVIRGTDSNLLTKDQIELLEFFKKTYHLREMHLQDSVSTHIKGQIFLLQTQHGYTPTTKVETSGTSNVVMEFGTDEQS